MKRLIDSCLALALLLPAASAYAADTPTVTISGAPTPVATTKKPIKPVSKVVAPVVEPQPDPTLLIAQARDAQTRGETELALRLAQSAIVADPARAAGYDALADVYAAANQPEAARSYYSEALSVDPGDAAAQRAIATLDRGGPPQQDASAREGSKTGTP